VRCKTDDALRGILQNHLAAPVVVQGDRGAQGSRLQKKHQRRKNRLHGKPAP
jgi:hypothetical protein